MPCRPAVGSSPALSWSWNTFWPSSSSTPSDCRSQGTRTRSRSFGKSMSLIIVVMTATLLIGGEPFNSEIAEISAAFREPRRTWPFWVGHLLAYAVALAVTIFVFNPGLELERPWLWVALWAASAICSFLLLGRCDRAASRDSASRQAGSARPWRRLGCRPPRTARRFRHLSALAPDEPT